MKNVTKANVLFTATVLVYIILVYSIRLVPAGTFSMNFLLVLPEVILLLPSFMYMAFMRQDNTDNAGFQKVSPLTAVLTVLFTFCMIPLVSHVNSISSLFVDNSVSSTLSTTVDSNSLIINLILLALIPAAVEEFIFRGLIFNGYKKRNPLKAALMSALLFGLIHMNINQFTYAFVIGIIFALLTYVTGSIIPSTIAHFVINGTSVVASHALAAMESAENTAVAAEATMSVEKMYFIAYTVLVVLTIVGLALGGLIFYVICKKNRGIESFRMIFKKPLRTTYAEEEGKFIDGYIMLGVIICVVYMVMYELA